MILRRRFADLPHGQVHYREGGAGGPAPIILLHGAGAAGASLLPLGAALAETRRAILPDVPGCGDSDPLPGEVDIPGITAAVFGLMDALGLDRCDLHGAHMGARIATEMALTAPDRVRRIVLDGAGFYEEAALAAMIANVAPEVVPDADGAYILRAYQMCRDYFLFFPWFARDAAHRRATGLPDPRAVHDKLVEVLRNGRTYGGPYRAALRYPLAERLPLLRHPVLLAANPGDNVFAQRARAAALVPHAVTAETAGHATPDAAATAAILARFLDAPDPETAR